MWVFKYKIDLDDYLIKYKSQLIVRGDLQTIKEDIYIITTAIQIFRIIIIIVTGFDLKV